MWGLKPMATFLIFFVHVMRRAFSANPASRGTYLGGGFNYFVFSSLPGEMIQFD